MKATVAKINAAIAARYPERNIEFVRGNGYFYFSGDNAAYSIPSIYICHLSHETLERWIEIVCYNIENSIEISAA